ncbi:excinuclease ABC subunit C [Clostridium acetobutylicum]|uniref:UvrABC system protein C n=1 Tax=Clostridium acetobutylicum (strain ATCC 824 / DSM 792 / JCM 1419 / IAM 19013 / LMG 5710 / NBRC 13948 / NRRL B-527 / VKM B-1787 / 2291 / W) TaxID=272562 RepID=UVRC_CLOAB|nr:MULTISPECIES: excinuclease ABC subunit UvrC [Clostridium]Q97LP6.1 RecName: Full=UvrABC system protein C; Short=Protein UvrC; AltName: Full=Excinuclease ABC subunit C [Clostridium acetobutylicum ATCC 824]AAK78488.1 Excinuclease ABC subunit C [Clostridium acetobutylicum ATCC 824]ADZ19558.1 excinuclease ABC subunit C [Clostridium acetobutylicum EA 2018]AEI34596.1 excinuclease ABC subunit C [Clostridium acetobutylicum DSM 1731]AWV80209.1 UvrABC system protein C [Clostridium acetobutylicum]MBC2
MFDFEYQLKNLPDKPGVYIMKNSLGEVIYVGKAKILKNRVRQYFRNSKNHSEKVKAMVKNISEFEYIVTDSEIEALILECNLIKKYKPRYNILLKDDKHYPFIKVTMNEDFPRIIVTRNMVKDGSKYFGPYPDVSAVHETVDLMRRIFPIRTCKKYIKENGENIRPCLNYHIKRCNAPCAGLISKEEYGEIIKKAVGLISGKNNDIIRELKEEMEKASMNLDFEKAADLRDKMLAAQKVTEKQKIIIGNFENEDYISLYSDEKDSCVQVFFLREGKIVGREHFIVENTAGENEGDIIGEFIKEFYSGTAYVPKSIYASAGEDLNLLENWLTMKRGSKVEIKIPQKGEKKDIIEMVKRNSKITLEKFKIKLLSDKRLNENILIEMTEVIGLEEVPHRIEAYDISNIQGVDSVGSMIVFEEGKPKNSDYRRFKIKTVKGANDYDSMREILTRRFKHGLEEVNSIVNKNLSLSAGKFCVFPDLILMDGGKGQVNIALEVLKEFNIDIPVCGMVKDDRHNTRGIIYNNNEIDIKSNRKIINFVTRVQDEVHRFAITYHRSLRDKRVLHSVLDDIPYIGEKRRKALLKHFGSIENIKKATYEELMKTPSIDKKAAESIVSYFRGRKGE